ncbi:MAG TPA: mandelate racemase/muconate lactonizing enzyme family protein [Gemmataceae bacterium]
MTLHSAHSRRDFLKAAALGAGALSLAGLRVPPLRAADPVKPSRGLRITAIDRVTLKVPFRPTPERNMAREIPHWKYTEVCQVRLASGHTGFGETLLYYTWGATSDDAVKRALGKNAAELMWDDRLGAGLQMALFDAVARAAEVPVHALLGRKVHDRTPLAWWNIDTSPEDMAAECKEAYEQGYHSYKSKGRPWFDVWAQVEAVSKAVPEEFKLALDFNDTLLDAERGIPILKDLAKYPQVGIWETPIFQSDIKGNQAIRKATRVPVAMHYGNPRPLVALKEEVCDGFLIGGGASRLVRQGAVLEMAGKPFWLQIVGTDVTAAWSLHFGGVLRQATWPAVNCHQLYAERLLTEPIAVKDGTAAVPDKPGLGFELNPDVLERFRVEKPPERPEPPRLIETRWPDGRKMFIANNGRVNFMLTLAQKGRMPYFERGVTTRLVPDDGSDRWRELWERARQQPVMTKG